MSVDIYPVIDIVERRNAAGAVSEALGALAAGADGVFLRDSFVVDPHEIFAVYSTVHAQYPAARIGLNLQHYTRAEATFGAVLRAVQTGQLPEAPFAVWNSVLPPDIDQLDTQEFRQHLSGSGYFAGIATYNALPSSHQPNVAARTVSDTIEKMDTIVTTGRLEIGLPDTEKIVAMHQLTNGLKPLAVAAPMDAAALQALQHHGEHLFEILLVTSPRWHKPFTETHLAQLIYAAHQKPVDSVAA